MNTDQPNGAQFNELVASLTRAERAAYDLGLCKTGHAINAAIQESGWEMAGKLSRKDG